MSERDERIRAIEKSLLAPAWPSHNVGREDVEWLLAELRSAQRALDAMTKLKDQIEASEGRRMEHIAELERQLAAARAETRPICLNHHSPLREPLLICEKAFAKGLWECEFPAVPSRETSEPTDVLADTLQLNADGSVQVRAVPGTLPKATDVPSPFDKPMNTWRCCRKRDHGYCNTVNDVEDETCGACGEPPLREPAGPETQT